MSESIIARGSGKKEVYESILDPIHDLLESESDKIANMANLCSVLKDALKFFWVGFYIVKGQELVLGPFQGSLACTRIQFGKGVCGSVWKEKRTIIVDDVDTYPNHIACSNLSKSEIVIPLIQDNEVWAVLDVDSDRLAAFDSTDEHYLSRIVEFLK